MPTQMAVASNQLRFRGFGYTREKKLMQIKKTPTDKVIFITLLL